MKLYKYDETGFLSVRPGVGVKVLHTERMSVAAWKFDKGVGGDMHSHPQEQIAYILKGRVEMRTEAGAVEVRAGDMIVFAGNEAHGSTALEDSIVLDTFSSPREDFKEQFVELAASYIV